MSPLRAGYLQCAKTLCGMFNNPILKKFLMPASNNLLNTSYKFEILLDIGSHSDTFSYLDGNNLGVEIGDIVSVRLRGRLLNGLTIAKNPF